MLNHLQMIRVSHEFLLTESRTNLLAVKVTKSLLMKRINSPRIPPRRRDIMQSL